MKKVKIYKKQVGNSPDLLWNTSKEIKSILKLSPEKFQGYKRSLLLRTNWGRVNAELVIAFCAVHEINMIKNNK